MNKLKDMEDLPRLLSTITYPIDVSDIALSRVLIDFQSLFTKKLKKLLPYIDLNATGFKVDNNTFLICTADQEKYLKIRLDGMYVVSIELSERV